MNTRPETRVAEISADVFRISTFVPEYNLEFNQFVVRDDEPLLYHTGMKSLFPAVREAVARLVRPEALRWIGFSHFEQDECGSLNEWLQIASQARPVCNIVSAYVNLNDFTGRQNEFLEDGATFATGRFRFRFISTPHVPHCWDASLLYEETAGTLFCSDLFAHSGEQPALSADIAERAHRALVEEQQGPFGNSMAYNARTDAIVAGLASLKPRTLAVMHGSSCSGDGARALEALRTSLREVLGPEAHRHASDDRLR
jgi:flavorubredoxin